MSAVPSGIFYDIYAQSVSAFGEDTCGTVSDIVRCGESITAMLVGGPEGGVRGNIYATFAVRVASSIAGKDEPFSAVAEALVSTLPEGGEHCSFALLRAAADGSCEAAFYGLPGFILLRHGKPDKIVAQTTVQRVGGLPVHDSVFTLKPADTVICPGAGLYSKGFQCAEMTEYLSAAYRPHLAAQKQATLLLNAAAWLQQKKPQNDLCVLALCAQHKQQQSARPQPGARLPAGVNA